LFTFARTALKLRNERVRHCDFSLIYYFVSAANVAYRSGDVTLNCRKTGTGVKRVS